MTFEDYKTMIRNFLDRQLSAKEFERHYFNAFRAEAGGMDPDLYHILQALFWAVENYWEGCPPGQETALEISEQQLRLKAHETFTKLEQYIQTHAP